MISSQSQKGGNDSTNIQAQQMVVNVGIDEKRAREICQEMNLQLRREYSQEAMEVARSRVGEFEDRLMEKMAQVQGAMDAFSDPGFQLLLVEAQKTAAATERSADYDLLSELLVHRFNRSGNRNTKAGISFAVEIVDKISDEALLGLTLVHAVNNFIPTSGDISVGLDVLNEIFKKIIVNDPPAGQDWLDHLDILNAVRLNHLGGMKRLIDFYSEVMPGYVDVGIPKDSEDHMRAIDVLRGNGIPVDLLVLHSLNADFVRLNLIDIHHAKQILIRRFGFGGFVLSEDGLSESQLAAIESVYQMYSKDQRIKGHNIESFEREWGKRESLRKLRAWWDGISGGITITSVGKVLAHANAQRCDQSIPDLN